jgi:hypothetical protein
VYENETPRQAEVEYDVERVTWSSKCSQLKEGGMHRRVGLKKALCAAVGAVLLCVFCVGLAPLLLQRLQLSAAAAAATDLLAARGMAKFRATPCQRKFIGIVVEGQVASANEAEAVEAVLRNARMDVDICLVLAGDDGATATRIVRSEDEETSVEPR